MSDQPRNLSQISHLFLSSVREKAQGPNRPTRTPPPANKPDPTVDLTPEEFAQVFGPMQNHEQSGPSFGPVRAVLASHLGTGQMARVREYAAHLCVPGQRVGLICLDASEFRLSIFEHNPHPQPPVAESHESGLLDPRKMSQVLEELAWDVDQWLLLLPSPRAPEARSLLRDLSQWTVLSTCDHDGIIACYRSLKGLSDLGRPRLTLATLDPASNAEATSAHQRLSSVCKQFLNWPLADESPVNPASSVTEHIVLWCSGTRDKAQLAIAPQWKVVADFLTKAKKHQHAAELPHLANPIAASPDPVSADTPVARLPEASSTESEIPQVFDLPDGQDTSAAIISAVLHGGHDLVECPVKAPMCPEASLAVSREHRLVLLAVASQGLNDLQQIGKAYQWLIENRALITMAVPQMAIDPHQLPKLHLLVDHADMSAQVLQPIVQSTTVTVHAYRKLRWGGKTGLLLEAA